MPRELTRFRRPVGKFLVGALWFVALVLTALAWRTNRGGHEIVALGLLLAVAGSIALWTSGVTRPARLVVSLALAGQISLLMVVCSRMGLSGELDVLPFVVLAALAGYFDRGAVIASGLLMAAIHAIFWNGSTPAIGLLLYLSLMALQTAGLGILAGKLREFAIRTARARISASLSQVTVVSPWSLFETGSNSRFELAVPAFFSGARAQAGCDFAR